MKKSVELAKAIAMMRKDVQALVDAGNAEEANAKAKELNAMVAEYNEVVTAENAAKNNFITNQVCGGKVTMDFKEKNRIFNKLLLGKALTAEEVEYANTLVNTVGTGANETNDADGAVLVPEEHYNQVIRLRKQYIPLKDYCHVYPAKSKSGTVPVAAGTTGKLVDFDELEEITKSKPVFGKVAYNLKLKGDIIPVSKALMNDADVDVIAEIGDIFAKKSVNTENGDILTLLAEKAASAITGDGVAAINSVLNVELDPGVSKTAQIITNQSGFDYLDNLVDKNGRPLLTVSLADETVKKYKGREIVVLKDADLANPEEGTFPFYVGDMHEAVMFFDRVGLEVAISTEAGFTAYATLLRAVERYDVEWKNEDAMAYVEITPAEEEGEG